MMGLALEKRVNRKLHLNKGETELWTGRILSTCILFLNANIMTISEVLGNYLVIFPAIMSYIIYNIIPAAYRKKTGSEKIDHMVTGREMVICSIVAILLTNILISLRMWKGIISLGNGFGLNIWGNRMLISVVLSGMMLLITLVNGLLRMFSGSDQLGRLDKILSYVTLPIPLVNMAVYARVLKTVSDEIEFETMVLNRNSMRKADKVCMTKYPILMVHGIFFRDYKVYRYWGRIPGQLRENGASVYFAEQESAHTVYESGYEIKAAIERVLKETGAPKVNIIAHSKGGLDARFALTLPGVAEHVASLITINAPHRGCEIADYLLEEIPENRKKRIASAYNHTMKTMGDKTPDFLNAVSNLTRKFCDDFNEEVKDVPGVYMASVGSSLKKPEKGGGFPLNVTYLLIKRFDGPNDGLVGEYSFKWGEDYTFVESRDDRGISHGDIIDLYKHNIPGFDVREFYVDMVSDLKKRGF